MRKYLMWGGIFFEVILIISLVRGIELSIRARSRVDTLKTRREELLQEREKLAEKLVYVQSEEYLESVARDELNLAKPGETVLVVPEGALLEGEAEEIEEEVKLPVYKQWWEVFFGQN